MITEGIVALIWAAAATYFFKNGDALGTAGYHEDQAAVVVKFMTEHWLGTFGSALAVLGVIAAPITSGDTAFRSARLIVADFLKMPQKKITNRLVISVPMFAIGVAILMWSLTDANGFSIIWRYFSWSNQTLSVFTLWACTVFLHQTGKPWMLTIIPALFMTSVCSTYICVAPEGFQMSQPLSYSIGGVFTLISLIAFILYYRRFEKNKKSVVS